MVGQWPVVEIVCILGGRGGCYSLWGCLEKSESSSRFCNWKKKTFVSFTYFPSVSSFSCFDFRSCPYHSASCSIWDFFFFEIIYCLITLCNLYEHASLTASKAIVEIKLYRCFIWQWH